MIDVSNRLLFGLVNDLLEVVLRILLNCLKVLLDKFWVPILCGLRLFQAS